MDIEQFLDSVVDYMKVEHLNDLDLTGYTCMSIVEEFGNPSMNGGTNYEKIFIKKSILKRVYNEFDSSNQDLFEFLKSNDTKGCKILLNLLYHEFYHIHYKNKYPNINKGLTKNGENFNYISELDYAIVKSMRIFWVEMFVESNNKMSLNLKYDKFIAAINERGRVWLEFNKDDCYYYLSKCTSFFQNMSYFLGALIHDKGSEAINYIEQLADEDAREFLKECFLYIMTKLEEGVDDDINELKGLGDILYKYIVLSKSKSELEIIRHASKIGG